MLFRRVRELVRNSGALLNREFAALAALDVLQQRLLDQVGTAARQCALTLAVAFLFLGGGQANVVTLPQLTHGPPVAPVRQGGRADPTKDAHSHGLARRVRPQLTLECASTEA